MRDGAVSLSSTERGSIPVRRRPGGAAAGVAAMGVMLVVGSLLCGCTGLGYRLGSTLPPDIKSIYVSTFINRTKEPQLEAETTRATVEELQRSLRVVGHDQADAILDVILTDYEQAPLRYDKKEAKLAREFRITITAQVVLKQRTAQTVLVDRKVKGETTFETLGELTNAKRDALPRVATDLGHQIVKCVVEYW